MKLYHGSNTEIGQINLQHGRKGKDFGQGFYLSPDFMQAVEFAATVVRREGCGIPIVTSFELNEAALNELNVKIFEGYTQEWAEFILSNRQNATNQPIHDYDIVIGPIADDTIGTQIRLLTKGYITLEVFLDRIKYKKITYQYFMGTQKALKFLLKL